MKKKISVIIPIYNSELTISNTIDSLLSQDYSTFELILINDGSIDSTEVICKMYANRDDRVRYFYKDNGGVSSARNTGLIYSTGEYIVFVDSDDVVNENFISILIETIDNKNIDLGIASYLENSKEVNVGNKVNNNLDTIVEMAYPNSIGGYVWNKIYKRDIIEKNHIKFPEDISHAEDLIFNLCYLLNSHYVQYSNEIVYHYISRSDSLTNKSKKSLVEKNYQSSMRMINILQDNDIEAKIRDVYYNRYIRSITGPIIRYSKDYDEETLKYCKVLLDEINLEKVSLFNRFKYYLSRIALLLV